MKFEELKLPYGYPVQLQAGSGTDAVKLSSRLLGCVPGKTLMVSVPKASRLRTGQKIIVRIMAANGICLFPAVLESTANMPLPMLCLSYPGSVQFKEIRGATRVDVGLAIQATNLSSLEEKSCDGKVSDISLSGAKIELREAIGEVGEELDLEMTVNIANLTRKLKIKTLIRSRIERSTREQDEEFSAVYGVEFKENNEEQLLGLYAYIYSAMAQA
ncbi:MAG: hypothetical protein AseanaTS_14890 [Candidatus Pelagadaptatus aseana]|uniref:flagellar brake protein n=1 Tax=Candidatus Pelagadaptatus aseana TaxID=3120508 RepID=UPI0039B2350C